MAQSVTADSFRSAANYIKLFARPLERAEFALEFGDGDVGSVLEELARFQNADGGFGHGIEPDFWMPESTPLATTVALQHFSALDVESDHPLVAGAIRYLVDSYDHDRAGWNKVSWEVEDAPHAPWWNYSRRLDGPFDPADWGNPSAEVIGYFHEHDSLVPDEFVEAVTELAFRYLDELGDEIEFHVLLCYLRLYERLDADRAGAIAGQLVDAGTKIVSKDPATWKSYHVPATWLAPFPDALLADPLRDNVEAYLDHLIEIQDNDGSWQPTWNWAEQYVHAWETAKRQWSGHITLQNLRTLQAYGRVRLSE